MEENILERKQLQVPGQKSAILSFPQLQCTATQQWLLVLKHLQLAKETNI